MKWVRQRCQQAPGSVDGDRVDEAGMDVGADELDAREAAGDEATDEREPGRAVL